LRKLLAMRVGILICRVLTIVTAACQAQVTSDLRSLYQAHKWGELNNRLQNTKDMPLYRGAIGVTFNQDPSHSESLLLSVIKAAPRSPEAYDAYEWLSATFIFIAGNTAA